MTGQGKIRKRMEKQMNYDVIIIGAGVSGCAIARELSRYRLAVAVLEKEEDVCCGTSKANSGIVHAGFDAPEGSLMARLNVEGNRLMGPLSKELDFPFRQNGSLVLCFEEEKLGELTSLYERGKTNGVEGLRILNAKEARELEPGLSKEVVGALYAPTGGIVCPFGLTIALAENAAENGVEFYFDHPVTELHREQEGWSVEAGGEIYRAACVVNAAGVHADIFHNMVSDDQITITPRKGEYCLLDKNAGSLVAHTVFQLPDEYGKGVLVTPTVHGNLLIGPTAEDITDKEGTNTTASGLDSVRTRAAKSVNNIPMNQVITSFAGLRAHEKHHEFIIGEPAYAKNFIDCAGIESPGLTSAPAIGRMVAELVCERLHPEKKESFHGSRKGILHPADLPMQERMELIREKPEYGSIVCRCEMVTEGEILDAIHRPLGARSLDGVKRRTRAGMGRCQAGFCTPKTMEILAREHGISQSEITKNGKGSELIVGTAKDRL